ncbi:MAG: nucleotide exchange factor GrpE [Candidatus Heimdallarchaeota archaeon]
MNLHSEKPSEEHDEIIEVDVEDFDEEDEAIESSETKSLEVDLEIAEMEKLKDEIRNLVEKNKINKLLDKFTDLVQGFIAEKKQKEEYLNTAQTVQANFENYKKRVYKDQEWSNFQNKQKILQKFLKTYEDIERTAEMFNNHPETKSVKEAVDLIYANLTTSLESLDVKVINPIDEIFNPQFHEAVYVVEKEEASKNQIVEVISKGFLLGNIVLKPARVVISKVSDKKENNS